MRLSYIYYTHGYISYLHYNGVKQTSRGLSKRISEHYNIYIILYIKINRWCKTTAGRTILYNHANYVWLNINAFVRTRPQPMTPRVRRLEGDMEGRPGGRQKTRVWWRTRRGIIIYMYHTHTYSGVGGSASTQN